MRLTVMLKKYYFCYENLIFITFNLNQEQRFKVIAVNEMYSHKTLQFEFYQLFCLQNQICMTLCIFTFSKDCSFIKQLAMCHKNNSAIRSFMT